MRSSILKKRPLKMAALLMIAILALAPMASAFAWGGTDNDCSKWLAKWSQTQCGSQEANTDGSLNLYLSGPEAQTEAESGDATAYGHNADLNIFSIQKADASVDGFMIVKSETGDADIKDSGNGDTTANSNTGNLQLAVASVKDVETEAENEALNVAIAGDGGNNYGANGGDVEDSGNALAVPIAIGEAESEGGDADEAESEAEVDDSNSTGGDAGALAVAIAEVESEGGDADEAEVEDTLALLAVASAESEGGDSGNAKLENEAEAEAGDGGDIGATSGDAKSIGGDAGDAALIDGNTTALGIAVGGDGGTQTSGYGGDAANANIAAAETDIETEAENDATSGDSVALAEGNVILGGNTGYNETFGVMEGGTATNIFGVAVLQFGDVEAKSGPALNFGDATATSDDSLSVRSGPNAGRVQQLQNLRQQKKGYY